MPEREPSERIATEAATIAVIADECIAAKSSLETWRRRVVIALGMIGTRFPIIRSGRRPKFFADVEVRERLVELHREVTLEAAVADCRNSFGKARTPSMSAVARFWRYLDDLQNGTKNR